MEQKLVASHWAEYITEHKDNLDVSSDRFRELIRHGVPDKHR